MMIRRMLVAAGMLACATVVAETVSDADREMIEKRLASFAPGMTVDSIQAGPIEGFFELVVGGQIVYMSADSQHVILGEILNARTGENLTGLRRSELNVEKLARYDESEMIVIGPEDAERYVTVFTDVDCPYCAKFHRDVPALNEAGVQVRYLLFPRTGLRGKSYQRSVGVWCADDRIESVGIAKEGGQVEFRECENPVKGHYALGKEISIRGTPAIILDDGTMIAGYVPPRRLLSELGVGNVTSQLSQ